MTSSLTLCLLFSLFLVSIQAVSPKTNSLCFYGGQLEIEGLTPSGKSQCIFGSIRVPVTVQEETVLCRYPALKEQSYSVSVTSGTDVFQLGVFEVKSCVQTDYASGCPGDKLVVTVTLNDVLASSNDYLCIWNGVASEVDPDGRTIQCPVPYHPDVEKWDLTLKTQDRRGYLAETKVLVSFQYEDCTGDVPSIISIPPSTAPWGGSISVLASPSRTRGSRQTSTPWCRYTTGRNSVHLEQASLLSDNNWDCPIPLLPLGQTLIEISNDGFIFSEGKTIFVSNPITGYETHNPCSIQPTTVTVFANTTFDPTFEYTCYFGSEFSAASIPSSSTLTCPVPQTHNVGSDLNILVHFRPGNRALALEVGQISIDPKC